MAKRRRRRVDPLRPYSEAELRAQANALVASAILPGKQQIRRAQAEARRQAEADAQTIAGFTRALTELVGPAGQRVEDVYGRATDRQRQIAEGFAAQQRQQDQASADAANQLLASQGQTRRIDPGTGSQVTYALGGMVPSNLLNETGAAMASIAHGYGAGIAGRGQQQLERRQQKARQDLAKINESMQELMAKVPGLTAEQLDRLYQREISKAATGIQGKYLGLAQDREAFDQSYDTQKLAIDAAAAAAAASGKKNEKKAAARKARVDALESAKAEAWPYAAELSQGKKVADASKISGYRIERMKPQQAFSQMWARFGSGLMRYAPRSWSPSQRNWWKRQITEMIWNSLTNNGFQRPRKPQRARDVNGPRGPEPGTGPR